MSSTGNIRGQRTQSSTGGYKTLGSSIASGNNGGSFKRIYVDAYQRYNGDSNLALTNSLKIPKSYYNSTSNSSNYQQPSLSGQRVPILTDPNALTLTQVYQTATANTSNKCIKSGPCCQCPCSPSPPSPFPPLENLYNCCPGYKCITKSGTTCECVPV